MTQQIAKLWSNWQPPTRLLHPEKEKEKYIWELIKNQLTPEFSPEYWFNFEIKIPKTGHFRTKFKIWYHVAQSIDVWSGSIRSPAQRLFKLKWHLLDDIKIDLGSSIWLAYFYYVASSRYTDYLEHFTTLFERNILKDSNHCFNSSSIRQRSKDLKHLISGNELP